MDYCDGCPRRGDWCPGTFAPIMCARIVAAPAPMPAADWDELELLILACDYRTVARDPECGCAVESCAQGRGRARPGQVTLGECVACVRERA